MSKASHASNKKIKNKDMLVTWFEKGNTPASRRLIGVESEKPPFYIRDQKAVPYIGRDDRSGILDFFNQMADQKRWQKTLFEEEKLVGLSRAKKTWTFEPGMQLETGGAPLKNVHQIARETDRTTREAVQVAEKLGIGLLAQGFHPTYTAKDMPKMLKSRHLMMNEFIKTHGFEHGMDLMYCTSSTQVNMGYKSEENMVKMLRVALSLQPIAVALFANSPFADGKPTGYQSYRSHRVRNTMDGRYGFMLPLAFDEGFGFEMFVDYALDQMSMLGVYQGDQFLDTHGAKFSDFMKAKLDICPDQRATMRDWLNHLNTIWPEVRLRQFMEMRGADTGPQEMIKALPAFWVGLMYDDQSLNDTYDLIKNWTEQGRDFLRIMTPHTGLQTNFKGTTVQDIAKECLKISEAGLKRRNVLNEKKLDESIYLEPLHEIANSGLNWAQRLEHRYNTTWNGDIRHLFNEMNFIKNPSVLKDRYRPPMLGKAKGASDNKPKPPPNL